MPFGFPRWITTADPAMSAYLNLNANTKNNPNENYARELMELHTLGVDAGYSQQDVTELARMLGDSRAKSALAHAEELLG